MKEAYITFGTAKLAKERGLKAGYPNPCYTDDGQLWISENLLSERITGKPKPSIIYAAPTQSALQRWLRKSHGISVIVDLDGTLSWFWKIQSLHPEASWHGVKTSDNVWSDEYESALEDGLQKALGLIPDTNKQ